MILMSRQACLGLRDFAIESQERNVSEAAYADEQVFVTRTLSLPQISMRKCGSGTKSKTPRVAVQAD